MSVHYHHYENKTLMDKRLRGTNRDIYDFMLALSHLHHNDLVISIAEIAEGISKSYETTRIHLNEIICMGFIKRIIRKDATRTRWNLKNRYIVIDIVPDNTPQRTIPEPIEYVIQGHLPQKIREPLLENLGGKESLEELRKDSKNTLKREATLPENLNNPDQITAPSETKTPETSKPSNQEKAYDLSGVPDIMRTTAEYFLLKTGKTSLTPKDVQAFNELSKNFQADFTIQKINIKCNRNVLSPLITL